ncbi:MAG: IreB family regulatory phosphoprotein [Andreesenia angusta]|nr:IreB family regulatory phosphoprotein [Andreesenia angusta]
MSDINKTTKFEIPKPQRESIEVVLRDVYNALEEKNYNPINQLVGYLLSADPTYITSHNEARTKIRRFEVDEIIEELLKNYLYK